MTTISTIQRACRVVHFQRKPMNGHFSVESHFADVRGLLSPRVAVDLEIMPRVSRGVLPRIQNMIAARQRQGAVNHIVGDVHYIAALLDPSRTILTVLDCDMLHRTAGLRRALLKYFWFTVPGKRVAAITVISEATRREVLRLVDLAPENVHVIPVFISPDFQYRPCEFNAEFPTILQIGTRHNKNLERLILALENVPCRLVVVGELSDAQRRLLHQCRVVCENQENLTSAEILTLYERSDLLCFASTLEGFGMPILEAQAVGRPVVTSNCSSMPEVAGDGAVLVDPYSVEDIRAKLLKVISDRAFRSDLVDRGQINARRFAPARIADRYCDLYESLHK
ncbi:MAG TPA: glycosyltransferase family 1 protein [Planctomycetaceae bacterium]|jgi:glycosyltransferase involved in cell wall biosynthesis